MKKKIRDLTDEEIYQAIYLESRNNSAEITYDNCKFCKKHYTRCNIECETLEKCKELIDTNAIRTSEYKNDKIEVEDD